MSAPQTIDILDYSPALLPDFVAINEAWVRELFVLERTDIEVLENAEAMIIERDGRIFFARHRDRGIVGTCALLKRADNCFELTKMGVRASARGLGAGKRLLEHALDVADALPIDNLFLLTNSACRAAIHLYRKHGFRDDADIMREHGHLYSRCDVAMRYGGRPSRRPRMA